MKLGGVRSHMLGTDDRGKRCEAIISGAQLGAEKGL